MTKPFPEVTVQPPNSTDNSKTDEFPHDHGSKKTIFLSNYTTQVREFIHIKRDVFQSHPAKEVDIS